MTPDFDLTGTGPVLLLLPGGAGHPMGLGPLTARLARRFTVVTYDPLGLAHGRLGEPVPDQRPQDWADGADRVLAAVLPPGERGYVFGTSSGGIAALALAARHPARLAHVLAHEPPCALVLPDGAERRRELIAALDGPGRPPAEGPDATPMGVFLAHVLHPFTAYVPAPALARLTLAAGTDSHGQLPYRAAQFLADGSLLELPGGHLGALEHPEEFADRLAEALTSTSVGG
ncbi:alpha/beta fold hydrolase [Streptomyces griseoluteus]|uniref:Alpha/beta fold hydrolase n=1 Tax=Streptomyces griseoluteus TaxID=29306 RepID=A0A4Z1DGB9_STRGP|nr:alpha/beta fold hydrolase [Streptomyces griseoluteus]TGN82463.1 alpha/beta fold hydrolase [Streptomyces griseoluteus]GHF09233.1 hydrolase [Streptomyces griseoluteus]